MEEKVLQRRSVQETFAWDMLQLLYYTLFLILLTTNICSNPPSYPLFKTKSLVENAMSAGQYPLEGVRSIPQIYDFLQYTIVPAVAAQNVTLLDARCTADGRHMNPVCLTNPFQNEGLCCFTKQPNKGIFAPGSHTKNILVSPLVLRQQRVMVTEEKSSPLGSAILRFPPLTAKDEETRDGGGTVLDHDREGLRVDWPSTKPWFKYHLCSGKYCIVDPQLGNPYLSPTPQYSQSGYKLALTGSAESILEEIEQLKKYEFLGGSTRGLFLDMTAYFPGERLFAIISILFEVSAADVEVLPSIRVRVSDLRRYSSDWLLVDFATFAAAMLLMFYDFFKMVRVGVKEYFSTHLFWKVVSWINYIFFIISCVCLIDLENTTSSIKGIVPMSEAAVAYPWLARALEMDDYRRLVSVNGLLSWLRLIRYLEQMSPSTQQLTNTISASLADLSIFVGMLMIVMFGFVFAFMLEFGQQAAFLKVHCRLIVCRACTRALTFENFWISCSLSLSQQCPTPLTLSSRP